MLKGQDRLRRMHSIASSSTSLPSLNVDWRAGCVTGAGWGISMLHQWWLLFYWWQVCNAQWPFDGWKYGIQLHLILSSVEWDPWSAGWGATHGGKGEVVSTQQWQWRKIIMLSAIGVLARFGVCYGSFYSTSSTIICQLEREEHWKSWSESLSLSCCWIAFDVRKMGCGCYQLPWPSWWMEGSVGILWHFM